MKTERPVKRDLRFRPPFEIPDGVLGYLTDYAFASRTAVTAIFGTFACFAIMLATPHYAGYLALATAGWALVWVWGGMKVGKLRATILNTLSLHPADQTWPVGVLSNKGPPVVLSVLSLLWALYQLEIGA